MFPIQAERLPWREIDERAVVLHPLNGKVHELNPVATLLWKHADGTQSLEALAARIAEHFDVEAEVALGDARGFFDSLAEMGLIRWISA